jgi:hypothetical protein
VQRGFRISDCMGGRREVEGQLNSRIREEGTELEWECRKEFRFKGGGERQRRFRKKFGF